MGVPEQQRRKNISTEQFQLEVGVEVVAFANFKQNNESKFDVNVSDDIMFDVICSTHKCR